nr:outer membrane beta-barrel protein [uncultured Flavobacterium sp.]
MKRILFILAIIVANAANAQKGSILAMGSFTYQSQNTTNSGLEDKTNYFSFSPKSGYQFHENWTAGIDAEFSRSKQEYMNNAEYKTDTYAVGGFLRYSKPLNQTFSAYADLGTGYQNRKERRSNSDVPFDYTNKGNGFYITVIPAILINVGNGFGLNFNIGGLGYSSINYDGDNGDIDSYENFNFTFGQGFSLGISKNF